VTRIPAAERRAALISAAMRVVAERGVAAATTRAIVAEAGMSLASFHYAFDSREELMAQLITHLADQEELSIAPALLYAPDSLSLRDVIRAGLQHYFEALRTDPEREKAMLELTHYAMRSAEMAGLARRQYDRYYAIAAAALSVAADRDDHAWSRPVEQLAVILVSLTDGLTLAWLVNRDDDAAAAIMDFAADAVAALTRTAPATTPSAARKPSTANIVRNA
jgi:Uncharacterized protein conserved in bacteria